jgi:hypothetical protein
MTANGQGHIVEHIEGIVRGANERGIHLQGEPEWRNFSKYGDRPAPPRRGARVRLGLDADGFVRQLQVLDDAVATSMPAADPTRDRQIRRQVAIKTAAQVVGAFAQCREEVKTDHLFPLADKILVWLEQPDYEPA